MANIPALPTGHQILTRGKAVPGVVNAYGPGGCHVQLTGEGDVVLTNDRNRVVASTAKDGAYSVVLAQVDPANIGYANRFIADWGKVERNWRTKAYSIKSGITEALASEVEAVTKVPTPKKPRPVEVIAPVVEATPAVVATPEPVAASPVMVETLPVVAPVADNLGALIPAVGKAIKAKRKTVAGQDMTILGSVYAETRHVDRLHRALERRRKGERGAVMVTGPSGTAKTLLVRRFADSVGLPLIIISGGKVRTADDWFGGLKQDHATGRFTFKYNPFGAALKLGTECIVLLDEANRAETPQALNAVLSLLDDTKEVWSPDANEWFTLPDGMLVCVTANVGAEYVATQPMDAAVVQRFGTGIRLAYPTETVEVGILTDVVDGLDKDVATTLVRMANQQRGLKDDMMQFPSGTGVSTRMLVDIGVDYLTSHDARESVDATFEAQFPVEDYDALTTIVDVFFPREAAATLDVDVTAINEADNL